MKFVIDAQLAPARARWLTTRGHEGVHVADLGLMAAPDAAIVKEVERTGAVLVSRHEDFVLLRLPDRFVLLWLRVVNATDTALNAWLEPRWPAIEQLLDAGEQFVEVR